MTGLGILRQRPILLIILLVSSPVASVHPHPHASKEVHDYHRKLRNTYPTSYINSALCERVSYEECLQMEEEMQDNARALQEIYQTSGFIRVLVLLVQFQDHIDRPLPSVDDYDELFNGDAISDDIIPTGSIKSFLDFNSYGKLQIQAEVVNWTLSDNTEQYYSFDRSGLDAGFRSSMYPALDRLEREGFDFSRFDQNGDGTIDSIVLLHSGYAAEVGGTDCELGAQVEQRIWSHAITGRSDNWASPSTGIRANGYSVSSGLRGVCQSQAARMSVITHEYIHTMGLPDLNDGAGEWIGRGLGEWDIMSNAHGRNGDQVHPSFLSPWSKMQLGWLEPIEITSDGVYSIESSELANQVYMIRNPFPDGEYLMIENRQPVLWDGLLWNGGILIWHNDEEQNLLKNRGYPGQPGWPGNGVHYAIALASPDGNYDMEIGNNGGDDSDYWRDGAVFGPGPVESEASDGGTYPNSNSYQFGNIQQTGIIIDEITSSAPTMSFRVTGLTMPTTSPTASPTDSPTHAPTVAPTVPATASPTGAPTRPPTPVPTAPPTTAVPTATRVPAPVPSGIPTAAPSEAAAATRSPPAVVPATAAPAAATATVVPGSSAVTGSPTSSRVTNIFGGAPSSDPYSVGELLHTAAPTLAASGDGRSLTMLLSLLLSCSAFFLWGT